MKTFKDFITEKIEHRDATKEELQMMKKELVKITGMKWRVKFDNNDALLMAAGRVELYPQLWGYVWDLNYYGQYGMNQAFSHRDLRIATKEIATKILNNS